jgi:predicted metal-dependent hydrolase
MRDREYDPRYLQFFECFNAQLFFEAHEALEELWLSRRQGPEAHFYKGLIQLAGAFVHLQRARAAPAARLLEMARANLLPYLPTHQGLSVGDVLSVIDEWLGKLRAANAGAGGLTPDAGPRLALEAGGGGAAA